MDHPQPDLALLLPRDMYYQLIHTLRVSLPPPVTAIPEDIARRDNAAITAVACLLPANADEANLAAQYVAASAQGLECLRLAREHPPDAPLALKCSAQAASMMRQARGFRSLLLRVQAVREKREADNASLDKAAWIEHCAVSLMADALGRTPPAPMPEPPPPPSAPMPAEEAAPQPGPLGEADQYAITYPRRAALIRSLGGLPAPCTFGPPEPELVQAIVTGASATLRALDAPAGAAAAPA
jgi:hypothetical protein